MHWARTIVIHVIVLLLSLALTVNFAVTVGGAWLAVIFFVIGCATAVSLVWTLTRWVTQHRRMARSASASG